MDKKRALLISAIFLGVSIALISAYTDALRNELTKSFGAEVGVVVAKEAIPEYGIIRPDMLEVVPVFKNFIQSQTVTVPMGDSAAEKKALFEVAGKAAYVPFYPGEQITLTKLIHQDGKPVLDKQVEKKMRAVTVAVSPSNGVGRFIRPGNRVDVLATVRYESNGAEQFEVKTVFQNVLVLATGKNLQNSIPSKVTREVLSALEAKFEEQRRKDLYTTNVETGTSRPDDNYTHMTLQLSPEEADKLLFLQHTIGDGKLYYTLRNGADTSVASLETTILDQVLGPDSELGKSKIKFPPVPPQRPRYYDQLGGANVPRY
jgi:pilus assembly protein CpaB